MRILITGGGTGGHLSIAKSLKEVAIKRGNKVIFVGSTAGQDRLWFKEDESFESRYFLKTSGVVNKKGFAKIYTLLLILKATLRAIFIVKKVDSVISVGGFSAAPASFAAILLSKPFFIHEQNARLGRLNRLLRPFAKEFFTSYDAKQKVKDYPVREQFFSIARTRDKVKTVIFLGGSQGAHYINELALKIAPVLQKKEIKIIHQAGEKELEEVKSRYDELNIKAEVFAFSQKIDTFMQMSDLAVSRSGASTLWELCAANLPALYIPYPYAASDHQYYNASFLVQKEASWLVPQEENPYEKLLELIEQSMKKPSEILKTLISPNGAQKIIEEIEKLKN